MAASRFSTLACRAELTAADGVGAVAGAILTNASVAGTLTHIAPEVLRGAPLDHRVDLWAFGVMLYEMTSGDLPFKRSDSVRDR